MHIPTHPHPHPHTSHPHPRHTCTQACTHTCTPTHPHTPTHAHPHTHTYHTTHEHTYHTYTHTHNTPTFTNTIPHNRYQTYHTIWEDTCHTVSTLYALTGSIALKRWVTKDAPLRTASMAVSKLHIEWPMQVAPRHQSVQDECTKLHNHVSIRAQRT